MGAAPLYRGCDAYGHAVPKGGLSSIYDTFRTNSRYMAIVNRIVHSRPSTSLISLPATEPMHVSSNDFATRGAAQGP